MARMAQAVSAGALALVLSACTAPAAPPPSVPATAEPSASALGQPGCEPASPVTAAEFPEIQGTASEGDTLYGLVMGTDPYPFRVSTETVKFVWRFTGDGTELTATLTDPAGTHRQLTWGPEYHGGSTYDRPGEEWGTGVTFDRPGCWTLELARDIAGDASVYFDVAL